MPLPAPLLLPVSCALHICVAASIMLRLMAAVPTCTHANVRRVLLLLLVVPLQEAVWHGEACCLCQVQQGVDVLPQLRNLTLPLPELLLQLPLSSIVPQHPHNLPCATPPALVAAVVLLHPTRCCLLSCQHAHRQPVVRLELSNERFPPLCTTYTRHG